MSPEQRAALKWAIEQARAKASSAMMAKMQSRSRSGAEGLGAVFQTMTDHANALQALLNGGGDAN